MSRHANPTLLTTRQVAVRCETDDESIQFAARNGMIHGQKVGGRWVFTATDCTDFCDALKAKRGQRQPRRRRFIAWFRWGWISGNGLLNFLASAISVAIAVRDRDLPGLGYALGALNFLAGGWGYLASREPRGPHEDWGGGQPLDPDVVALRDEISRGWPAQGGRAQQESQRSHEDWEGGQPLEPEVLTPNDSMYRGRPMPGAQSQRDSRRFNEDWSGDQRLDPVVVALLKRRTSHGAPAPGMGNSRMRSRRIFQFATLAATSLYVLLSFPFVDASDEISTPPANIVAPSQEPTVTPENTIAVVVPPSEDRLEPSPTELATDTQTPPSPTPMPTSTVTPTPTLTPTPCDVASCPDFGPRSGEPGAADPNTKPELVLPTTDVEPD
jgi:hypothetical protein